MEERSHRLIIGVIKSGKIEAGKEVPLVAAVDKAATQLQTVAYASTHLPGISVSVFIENPKNEKVFIRLKCETQGPLYKDYIDLHEESTLLSHYSVNLNLTALKASHYRLEVSTASKRYLYQVYIRREMGKIIKIQPY